MNEFVFFVFSVFIFFASILITSSDKLNGNIEILRIIKTLAILGPTIASGMIITLLFSKTFNNNNINTDSVVVGAGLSIFGILATVWIGLNIYNTVEKKELDNFIKNSKIETQTVIKKIEDIAKIQVESNIADSQINIKEKLMHYNNIVNKYNDYDLPYILRANLMFKNNFYEEAVSDYNIALLKNSENKYLYYDRGKCYFYLKKYNKAIEDFTITINCNLYVSSSMKNRALAYQKMENYEKAISEYTQIITTMDPEDKTYNNRGICYLNIESYALALDDFNKAIKLSDGHNIAYYKNRMLANKNLYNFSEVINDIDMLISYGIKDEMLYLMRSDANKALGNYKEADFDKNNYTSLEAAVYEDS